MERIWTDLPIAELQKGIVVVMPRKIQRFRGNQRQFTDQGYQTATLKDIEDFQDMEHVGLLSCNGPEGEPTRIDFCGGSLEFSPIPADESNKRIRESSASGYHITCSGCSLNLTTPRYDRERFSNAMFHLAIKQMNPFLRCCNFLDCSAFPAGAYNEAQLFYIRGLGVMAVDYCLWGIKSYEPTLTPGHCGLGFILMPNIHSRTEGPGELGPWLQFLFYMKMEQVAEELAVIHPKLLGPK